MLAFQVMQQIPFVLRTDKAKERKKGIRAKTVRSKAATVCHFFPLHIARSVACVDIL